MEVDTEQQQEQEQQIDNESTINSEEKPLSENTNTAVFSFSVASEDNNNSNECNNSQDNINNNNSSEDEIEDNLNEESTTTLTNSSNNVDGANINTESSDDSKVIDEQPEEKKKEEEKEVTVVEQTKTTPNPSTPSTSSPSLQSTSTGTEPVVSSINIHHNAKLIQVTGKKEPFYFIPVPLAVSSLNLTDAFIMQSDSYMFVWSTDKCHSQKKAKAIQMAQKLKVEIGCERSVQALEVGEEHPTFLWCLGVPKGTKLTVTKERSNVLYEDDGTTEREPEFYLYRVGKVEGKLNVIPIEEEVITQEMFESTSCFIFDCENEIYVWQGEKSSMEEKEVSMTLAKRFLTMFERPKNTSITAEYDGAEGCIFRSKFTTWKEKERPGQMQSYLNLNKKKDPLTFNVADMHQEKEVVKHVHLNSKDNKGKLLLWSYNKGKWEKVEEDDFGIFYSNRSYVCNFIYKPDGKNSIKAVIFYWEGNYSSNRAYIAYKFGIFKEIQKKMQALQSDDPIEFRISQNKEPEDFIQLFGNEIIVLNEELSLTKPMMFQIRGDENNVRGTQLTEVSASRLNSLESFTIIIPKKCILVWYGKGSNDAERQLAADLFTFLPPEYEAGVREIEEGEEPESFWKIMGGRADYPSVHQEKPPKTKLFLCTENSGIFKADQVKPFAQVDLNQEENIILDLHSSLFVWRGSKTTESKFEMTLKVAQEYLVTANDDRPTDLEVKLEKDGEESSLFRAAFVSWKITQQKVFIDPWEVRKQKAAEEEKAAALAAAQAAAIAELTEESITTETTATTTTTTTEEVKESITTTTTTTEEIVKIEEVVVTQSANSEGIERTETKVEIIRVEEEVVVQPTISNDNSTSEVEDKEVDTLTVEESKDVTTEETNTQPPAEDTEQQTVSDVPTLTTTPPLDSVNSDAEEEEEEEVKETTNNNNNNNSNESNIGSNNSKTNSKPSSKKSDTIVTLSESGDLLFSYDAFNVALNSPKSLSKKGKKKKNRNRSLSQNSTPTSSPISKSCELPPPSFNLSNETNNNSNNSNNNNNSNGNSPHFSRRNRHNRTGSYNSPLKIGLNNSNNNSSFSPKIKSNQQQQQQQQPTNSGSTDLQQ